MIDEKIFDKLIALVQNIHDEIALKALLLVFCSASQDRGGAETLFEGHLIEQLLGQLSSSNIEVLELIMQIFGFVCLIIRSIS